MQHKQSAQYNGRCFGCAIMNSTKAIDNIPVVVCTSACGFTEREQAATARQIICTMALNLFSNKC